MNYEKPPTWCALRASRAVPEKPRFHDHRDADDNHDPQDPLLEVLVDARHGHPVLQHTPGEGAEKCVDKPPDSSRKEPPLSGYLVFQLLILQKPCHWYIHGVTSNRSI